jgi:hypothetical protein
MRGHWGNIENRTHWRRDAVCGEDRTRSRKPRMVVNLALLRSATFRLLSRHHPEQSLPEMQERSADALALLRTRSCHNQTPWEIDSAGATVSPQLGPFPRRADELPRVLLVHKTERDLALEDKSHAEDISQPAPARALLLMNA